MLVKLKFKSTKTKQMDCDSKLKLNGKLLYPTNSVQHLGVKLMRT